MPAKSSSSIHLGLAAFVMIGMAGYGSPVAADVISNAATPAMTNLVANTPATMTNMALNTANTTPAAVPLGGATPSVGSSNNVISSSGTTNGDIAAAPVVVPEDDLSPPPPILEDLQEQSNTDADGEKKTDNLGLNIRTDALKEAAQSYGARGGLAYRTFEIQRRLAEYDSSLSKAFDFSRLLIAAPTGLLIEPPVITEAQRAVLVKTGGQTAAVADRIYRINRVARIVTASRNWHLYLERDWGKVDPPASILLPKDDDERAAWRKYVQQGWEAGIKQAEETFESDLDRLTNDFTGMVRYRELLAQNMISPPYALANDRGVTGGGSEMRVGDRGLTITGPSALIPRSDIWTPAPR